MYREISSRFYLMAIVAMLVTFIPFPACATDDADVDKAPTLADSTNPVLLPEIVVEANRVPLTLFQIPTAANIVYLDDHKRQSLASVGELAGQLPGLRSYSTGNIWGQREVDVRGFYGGGQAQYLLVTYDGIPLNNISSGLVNFNDLELADIGRAESIGGPVSAQYGDFGFGGMLALYSSREVATPLPKLTMTSGSDNAFGVNAQMTREVGAWRLFASASRRTNQGWRKHSRFESQKLFIKATNSFGDQNSFSTIVSVGKSEEENPGAMTAATMAKGRADVALDLTGNPRQDKTDVDEILAAVTSTIAIGNNIELRPQAYYKSSKGDNIVTITSSMIHRPEVTSTGAEISAGLKKEMFGQELKLVAGGGVEYGQLETLYADRDSTVGTEPVAISSGTGTRLLGSAYVHALYYVTDKLYVATGARIDNVDTDFEERTAAMTVEGTKRSQSEFSFTPKFAAGYHIVKNLSVYGSVAGAFKSPTLVHLYDSSPFATRVFPYPLPPYMGISNSLLKAQEGTSYELGFKYSDMRRLYTSVSFFSYRISNEIDFDEATNSYQNLDRTRHTGLEASLAADLYRGLSTEMAFSINSATFGSGNYKDKQLNGIPRFTYRFSLEYTTKHMGRISLGVNGLNNQYLDKDETIELGDYSVASASYGLMLYDLNLAVRVDNLFDRSYNATGYMDPLTKQPPTFQDDSPRYIPAPGRTFQVSLATNF